jgi:hypothetical protein
VPLEIAFLELGKAGTYTGELDGVMQAQVCAAFHRGVILQPEDWDDETRYYMGPQIKVLAEIAPNLDQGVGG